MRLFIRLHCETLHSRTLLRNWTGSRDIVCGCCHLSSEKASLSLENEDPNYIFLTRQTSRQLSSSVASRGVTNFRKFRQHELTPGVWPIRQVCRLPESSIGLFVLLLTISLFFSSIYFCCQSSSRRRKTVNRLRCHETDDNFQYNDFSVYTAAAHGKRLIACKAIKMRLAICELFPTHHNSPNNIYSPHEIHWLIFNRIGQQTHALDHVKTGRVSNVSRDVSHAMQWFSDILFTSTSYSSSFIIFSVRPIASVFSHFLHLCFF